MCTTKLLKNKLFRKVLQNKLLKKVLQNFCFFYLKYVFTIEKKISESYSILSYSQIKFFSISNTYFK